MKSIEISLEDIREAELILLGEGKSFCDDDNERISFIQNLKTCDLLAVPGSGKTTALLAKLYCINKHLPFEDGSGILVLSHTNAAIDEIKEKLRPHCPRLFQYPNFIDTVQSFINKHLAIPRFVNKLGFKPLIIDSAQYNRELEKLLKGFFVINEVKSLFRTPNLGWLYTYSIERFEEAPRTRIIDRVGGSEIDLKKPKGNAKKYTPWDQETKSKVIKNLIEIKKKIWDKGVISFDDSYLLSNKYLEEFPLTRHLLQLRFKYTFIDEMQDLQQHQIDIIDSIFPPKDSISVIQRIGDKNQAIYSSSKKVKVESVWRTREEQDSSVFKDLIISGSNRLTQEVAAIVDCLVLDRAPSSYKVVGNRVLDNPIKPILVVFRKERKRELLSLFKTIIQEHQQDGKIPLTDKNGNAPIFKLIAWSGEWGDERTASNENKIRLEDVVDYSKEVERKKELFDTLSKHLQLYDKRKGTLVMIKKSILNALIHVLRLEEKTYPTIFRQRSINRYYTKNKLVESIKERSTEDFHFFNQELYDWCWQTITGNERIAYNKIKEFISTTFKDWFELNFNLDTQTFLETEFNVHSGQTSIRAVDIKEDIDISIGTVHSVKGQTHCATMYVETAYQTPTYESNKLIKGKKDSFFSPFFLNDIELDGVYAKQAKKMIYVGFSRPTHLLCFAALNDNVEKHIAKFESAGWIVDNRCR